MRSLSCSGGRVRRAHCHSNSSFLDAPLIPRSSSRKPPARPRRSGVDRPRRALRCGAFRRGGKAGRSAHCLRGRAHPRRPGTGFAAQRHQPLCAPGPPIRGSHLVSLPATPRLRAPRPASVRAISPAREGRPRYDIDRLAEIAGGHLLVLTVAARGQYPKRSSKPARRGGKRARPLIGASPGSVVVELFDHDDLSTRRAICPCRPCCAEDLGIVATNVVHHALPQAAASHGARRGPGRRPLDELDGWLPAAGRLTCDLRLNRQGVLPVTPGRRTRRRARARLLFHLHLVAPNFPTSPCLRPSEMTFLRQLVEDGATRR